jgi:hypothetical protein
MTCFVVELSGSKLTMTRLVAPSKHTDCSMGCSSEISRGCFLRARIILSHRASPRASCCIACIQAKSACMSRIIFCGGSPSTAVLYLVLYLQKNQAKYVGGFLCRLQLHRLQSVSVSYPK